MRRCPIRRGGLLAVLLALLPSTPSTGASAEDGFPTWVDATAQRLVASASVSTADLQEKDYAWGDLDADGDIDLICVRKEPWNTTGRFRNVLFMNEGVAEGHAVDGVLVDRTVEYADASLDGLGGMMNATNDRDVLVVDVDGDGWLDVVTSTTYGEGFPKRISHPRVYMNLGESAGEWQGLRFEPARTPTMPLTPHFCGVGVGDISGDESPDLYFVDYNGDLEDRLWINDGTGFFTDETEARLTFEMRESDFGVHAVIADMNGDGVNDVVKDRGSTTTTPPLRVTIAYNDPGAEGVFNIFDITYNGNPYHTEVGDLNGDGRLDLVIDDDSIDRYLLNTGNGPDGRAEFIEFQFPPESNLFGGNIVIHDLDQDGRDDVMIADVDVDCCGCDRNMHIWRNVSDPGFDVDFEEALGGIPVPAKTGTHDIAVFDIDGNGWDDLVIGTCTGMSIWMMQGEVRFDYPDGIPGPTVPVDVETTFDVSIGGCFGAEIDPATAIQSVSIDGALPVITPVEALGGDLYRVTLPASPCGASITWSVEADTVDGATFAETPQSVLVVAGIAITFDDDVEGDVSAWQITSDPSMISGQWEAAVPEGTIQDGAFAAPPEDASEFGTSAFVTQNGPPGIPAGLFDIDLGPTWLVSPPFDGGEFGAVVSFARWFFTTGDDELLVELSNDDGATWHAVPSVPTGVTGSSWERVSFATGEVAAPTATMRVRYTASDVPNDSIAEAGIDDVLVERLVCGPSCPADIDGSGDVAFNDLLSLLAAWGPCFDCPADLDGDGNVGFIDLLAVLAAWGPCEA